MKHIHKLGLYDSGLGGYSIFQDLLTHYPNLDTTLFADQKNAPYGNKSDELIIKFALDAMAWFDKHDFEHVLVACNTVSAVALDAMKKHFPHINIYGIIDLTVTQIEHGTVGVISTKATYLSHAYPKLLETKGLETVASYAPQLVNLIEGMQDSHEEVKAALTPFKHCDTLILACTHYPLVRDVFAQFFAGDIVDSRAPIRAFLSERIVMHEGAQHHVFTSGDPISMQTQIVKLFGNHSDVEGV